MGTAGEHRPAAPRAEQLALDLPPPPAAARPLIVTECNRAAAALAARPDLWPGPAACLVGPPRSGKTRLAETAFAGAAAIERGRFSELAAAGASPAGLSAQGGAGAFWFDDLDLAHAAAAEEGPAALRAFESALFHLLNQLAAGGGRLLAAARAAPAHWPVRLPDLATRLRIALVLRIEPPDDAMLGAYLERRFQERGLAVRSGVIDFLALRLERSFEAADRAVARIDAASLRLGRAPTRELAQQALGLAPPRARASGG